ncbi:MAG TPA: hypothetical protein VHS96_09860 [Bacteroidia bacterium]|nr:hypothetical protein [Bacteroidia bacterium]
MSEVFEAKQMREAVVPKLNQCQMARKMGIDRSYLLRMENGVMPWPTHRKADFLRVLHEWRANPTPIPRKGRKDVGKRRRRWRRRSRAEMEAARALAVVPHSHGEVTGIG